MIIKKFGFESTDFKLCVFNNLFKNSFIYIYNPVGLKFWWPVFLRVDKTNRLLIGRMILQTLSFCTRSGGNTP